MLVICLAFESFPRSRASSSATCPTTTPAAGTGPAPQVSFGQRQAHVQMSRLGAAFDRGES
jgi:hypothetical protein